MIHESRFGLLLVVYLAWRAALSATPPQGDAPADVDLRPAFAKWGLSPRIQGGRGTCSVFTITGAIEYALAHKRDGGTRLSVEYLNWASNKAINEMRDGGFFSDLWRGFAAYGICPEPNMPYRDKFDSALIPDIDTILSARTLLDEGLRLHWIKRWNVNTGLTAQQLAEIKHMLDSGWPVCGGFRWPRNVQWKDDLLVTPPPDGVIDGHSVLIVGYRDDPGQPGGGTFMFRNSQSGRDAWMTYAYACAYMNDAVWIDYEQQTIAPSEPVKSTEHVSHEAYLFHLGINRVLCAYRLASDTVCNALEMLVQSGVMSDRHIRDETISPERPGAKAIQCSSRGPARTNGDIAGKASTPDAEHAPVTHPTADAISVRPPG